MESPIKCVHEGEIKNVPLYSPEVLDGLLKSRKLSFLDIPDLFGIKRVLTEHDLADGMSCAAVEYRIPEVPDIRSGPEPMPSPKQASLKNVEEVHRYLQENNLALPLLYFCFDPEIRTDCSPCQKELSLNSNCNSTIIVAEDLCEGQERVPIPVVCEKPLKPTKLKTYIKTPVVSEELQKKSITFTPNDDGFLQCCDCEDDCKDKLNCECFKRTLDNCSQKTRKTLGDKNIGYKYQRLDKSLLTGIFECNKRCKCNQNKIRCLNRVVQNGMFCALQLFMTEEKGWGVRTLTDIPKGSFVCTYAGEVISEAAADEIGKDWFQMLWVFLSELRLGEDEKENYEADVVPPSSNVVVPKDQAQQPMTPSSHKKESLSQNIKKGSTDKSSGRSFYESFQWEILQNLAKNNFSLPRQPISRRNRRVEVEEEDHLVRMRKEEVIKNYNSRSGILSRAHHSGTEMVTEHVYRSDFLRIKEQEQETSGRTEQNKSNFLKKVTKRKIKPRNAIADMAKKVHSSYKKKRAKLTLNIKRPRSKINFAAAHQYLRLSFSIDGMKFSNVGAYINHSCNPNLFPQYVFWDCPDLRLPIVAFFAARNIKSGEEITWNYNYEDQNESTKANNIAPIKLLSKLPKGRKRKRMTPKNDASSSGSSNGGGVDYCAGSIGNKKPRMLCRCNEVNCKKVLVW